MHITVNAFIHTEESLKLLWAVIDSIKTNIEYLQYWMLLCLTELVWSCVLPLHVASLHACIQWWISSLMNTSRRPIKRLSASTERWTCSHTLTSSTPNPLIWQIHFPGRGRGGHFTIANVHYPITRSKPSISHVRMRDLLLRDGEDLAHSQGEISQPNERSFAQHTMTVNNTSTLRKLKRWCVQQQC